MKKIIAMLLVLSMVLSFAACGKKDEPVVTVPVPTEPAIVETEPTLVETEPVIEETEPVVEPEVVEPEVPAIEALVMPEPELPADEALIADKQATYEKVFTEGTFTMNTDAISMNFANLFKMGIFVDESEKTLLTLSGAMEGLELGLELYIVSDTEAYYHRKGVEEGVAMDEWYKLVDLVNEEGESAVGEMTSTTSDFTQFTEGLQSVTYKGQVDGKDAIEVVYIPQAEDVEMEMEGEEALPATMLLLIDPETYTISGLYMEEEGMIVMADFSSVADLATICEVPDDVTETMTAEEAVMEIAFGMMGFIFASAESMGAGME